MGVPSNTSPAPPGGNGGRKNAEGGSKFPPGKICGRRDWLRDGQMTMAGRPGPECRPRETYTLLGVGSGCYTKCTEQRPSQRIWQGDPFTHPHPSPASPLPFYLFPTSPLSALLPFVDIQLGGDELTQRVKKGQGALSPPLLLLAGFFFFREKHKKIQLLFRLLLIYFAHG